MVVVVVVVVVLVVIVVVAIDVVVIVVVMVVENVMVDEVMVDNVLVVNVLVVTVVVDVPVVDVVLNIHESQRRGHVFLNAGPTTVLLQLVAVAEAHGSIGSTSPLQSVGKVVVVDVVVVLMHELQRTGQSS